MIGSLRIFGKENVYTLDLLGRVRFDAMFSLEACNHPRARKLFKKDQFIKLV